MKKIILLLIITFPLLIQPFTLTPFAAETNGYVYDSETYTYKKPDNNTNYTGYEHDPAAYNDGYAKGYDEAYDEGNKITDDLIDLILIVIFVIVPIICGIAYEIKKKIISRRQYIDNLKDECKQLQKRLEQQKELPKLVSDNYRKDTMEQKRLKLERDAIDAFRKNAISEIKKLINKKLNYPYMAEIVADYHKLLNERYATDLLAKPRPALKASATVSMLSKELHQTEKREKLLKYQLSIYENVFPWLADFKEFSIDDLEQITSEEHTEQDEITTLRNWLSPTEYNNLSTTEKYQLALERYKKSHKTNWQIGVAFERYIGYLYETKGYKVSYFGATKGLDDLGRDLILSNKDEIIAVQCKYWNKNKAIHEKHIFQLYGTMFALSLDTKKKVKGLFITSTSLSDTAKLYAEKLNIDVQENVDFDKEYPCIKCNISKSTGEKIYHLPFDQQYDRIIIDAAKGEKYVQTIEEAESLGFRRAFRHFS